MAFLKWNVTKIQTEPTVHCLYLYTFLLLSQGGTGFAGSGVTLNAKEARPVMQV